MPFGGSPLLIHLSRRAPYRFEKPLFGLNACSEVVCDSVLLCRALNSYSSLGLKLVAVFLGVIPSGVSENER
jgi:hypothetical protein